MLILGCHNCKEMIVIVLKRLEGAAEELIRRAFVHRANWC